MVCSNELCENGSKSERERMSEGHQDEGARGEMGEGSSAD